MLNTSFLLFYFNSFTHLQSEDPHDADVSVWEFSAPEVEGHENEWAREEGEADEGAEEHPSRLHTSGRGMSVLGLRFKV